MKFLNSTAPAIRALDRQQTLVVFPTAAVEQHGPHLPCGTDTLISDAIADAVEARAADRVLRLPTQWIGASAHHLRLGATLDSELPTYIQLLCQTLQPLLEMGFCRFLILNGHGGNIDPMRVAVRQLQSQWPDRLLAAASYWSIAEAVIADHLTGEDKAVGHACEAETALILHLHPELVDTAAVESAMGWKPDAVEGMFICRDMKQRTAAGATGRPDLATAEQGRQMFEGIVDRVCVAVDRLLAEPLPS
ncbi:creatininase family protein [Rosistilla oblonga]|uniref:creatininase family protein n=1 Tax=Rosistilla oblonga TaxID=2527990 RepID=UPI003A970606